MSLVLDWYRLFNLTQFEETALVSAEAKILIPSVGEKTILITKGNGVSILVDDIFLTINLNNKNPLRFGMRAVYLDENDDVWLGIINED